MQYVAAGLADVDLRAFGDAEEIGAPTGAAVRSLVTRCAKVDGHADEEGGRAYKPRFGAVAALGAADRAGIAQHGGVDRSRGSSIFTGIVRTRTLAATFVVTEVLREVLLATLLLR
jgi:hypothetical protein